MNTATICLRTSAAFFLMACSTPTASQDGTGPSAAFRRYWYNGQAELSHYRLTQNRYDAQHPGEAVLVFVTEDFLPSQQVKYEGAPTKEKPVSVLKMNQLYRFVTGIYDYAILTSVFTPVTGGAQSHSLKVTNSVQEWCGQTYTQLNLKGQSKYALASHSYFQAEADEENTLPAVWLEDELWTRLRAEGPQVLPTGTFRIIPGTVAARLRHRPLQEEEGRAELQPYQGSDFLSSRPDSAALQAYTLTYPASQRTLRIVFEDKYPHLIAGWDDTYGGQMQVGNHTLGKPERRTTRAVRTHTIRSAYWQHHAPADTVLRPQLGMDGH